MEIINAGIYNLFNLTNLSMGIASFIFTQQDICEPGLTGITHALMWIYKIKSERMACLNKQCIKISSIFNE